MSIPPTIEVASLGMWNTLVLMVMALVVFGPRRMPEIGRQIGKLMYELRKASNDFKFQMEEELRSAEEADRHKKDEERLAALTLAAPAETVSQVSESRPGPPAQLAATDAAENPYPSPYPGEDQYPPVDVPVDGPAIAPETPAKETPTEPVIRHD